MMDEKKGGGNVVEDTEEFGEVERREVEGGRCGADGRR